ncbi:LysR family transcriptional regulator [Rhodanobacter hydrolyticus]|uniref:LysR family transcriptional regulator n=1 Tax=Rhodanobacter hydrolyticus TaxID=2250595 RepID=A0ABW8J2S7_9GAMM
MTRTNYNDLLAFLAVARERNFTRAAAQLGVSQSALSHTLRALEARLGLRLLTRTTRSVMPTEAGERLFRQLSPNYADIDASIAALGDLRDRAAGTVRITANEHSASTILWPALRTLLPRYPDIHVEVVTDSALTDIVAERFDAGIRLGEQVAKGMIAVPIGPPMRMAVVGAPSYLGERPAVRTPRDLTSHDCINLRFLTLGNLYAWEFERDGHALNVRVEGRLTFNNPRQVREAALDGFGLACLPEDVVRADIKARRLRCLLSDWCPPFPGYHLYYPSRRQHPRAFALLVEALRRR